MEMILYDVVLLKLLCVQNNFVQIVSILFLPTPRN